MQNKICLFAPLPEKGMIRQENEKQYERYAKKALEPYRRTSVFAGRTRKRKETCAGKDRVLTEAKRRRKGHQTLNYKRN